MKSNGSKFARKHDAAIAVLLEKPTVAEAAQTVGVGESTLRRWLNDEDFQFKLQAARDRLVGRAVTGLRRDAAAAASLLRSMLDDPACPASARVAAAKCILNMALKSFSGDNLSQKLEVLDLCLDEAE